MHIIIAVYDRQLDAYMRPFTAQSAGQAIRSFSDEVNRTESELNKHPEDYELHKLAEWDENSGKIWAAIEGPEQLAIASNLIERQTK